MTTQTLYTYCLFLHEALSILYTHNSFCFSDPATASALRNNIAQAILVQEIVFKMKNASLDDPGRTYITRLTPSLTQDFPNLRWLVIDLGGVSCAEVEKDMGPVFDGVGQHIRGLDWIYVRFMDDTKVLRGLEPAVEKEGTLRNSEKAVQKYIDTIGFSFKRATIWWGYAGEKSPYIHLRE